MKNAPKTEGKQEMMTVERETPKSCVAGAAKAASREDMKTGNRNYGKNRGFNFHILPTSDFEDRERDGDDDGKGDGERRRRNHDENDSNDEDKSWPKSGGHYECRETKAYKRRMKEERERRERGRFMKKFYEACQCEDKECKGEWQWTENCRVWTGSGKDTACQFAYGKEPKIAE